MSTLGDAPDHSVDTNNMVRAGLSARALSLSEQAPPRPAAPFVTNALVEASKPAIMRAIVKLVPGQNADAVTMPEPGTVEHDEFDQFVREILLAVAPLWLAHVQQASEHTADYQMAEAAAAELRRLATTPPAGPADTGETTDGG